GVDYVDGRQALDVPPCGDRPVRAAVPPGALAEPFPDEGVSGGLPVGVAVDAEEHEGLAGVALHERPLVGVHAPARRSPAGPEIQYDHLAPVVAQLEGHAVRVFAVDVGRRMADARTGAGHALAGR